MASIKVCDRCRNELGDKKIEGGLGQFPSVQGALIFTVNVMKTNDNGEYEPTPADLCFGCFVEMLSGGVPPLSTVQPAQPSFTPPDIPGNTPCVAAPTAATPIPGVGHIEIVPPPVNGVKQLYGRVNLDALRRKVEKTAEEYVASGEITDAFEPRYILHLTLSDDFMVIVGDSRPRTPHTVAAMGSSAATKDQVRKALNDYINALEHRLAHAALSR
jgi:hypothetical protein